MKLVKNLPASEYHQIKALSASSAKLLLRSPAHYLAAMDNPREPTASMRLGTLCHTLFFEPDKLNEEFAVMPKVDKRTKFGKEAAAQFEEQNQGKVIVDEYQFEKAQAIAAAAKAHPIVQEYMTGGDAEVTMLWEEYGVPCKARVDYLCGNVIFDLKTCQDASPEGFARQIGAFQYHLQAAHYANGYEAIHGKALDRFVFVAVESEPPFATGVYVVNKYGLQDGRTFMARAAKAFKKAQEPAKVAACYSNELVELALPNWAAAEPLADKFG
jgi:hypothetical protein